MRRRKHVFILVCLALLLLLSSCAVSGEGSTAEKLMLEKYYISSPENESAEFAHDFEQRLLWLFVEAGLQTDPAATDAKSQALLEEFTANAASAGMPLEDYLAGVGVRLPSVSEADPNAAEYYRQYALAELQAEAAVKYLAELWEIELADADAQKNAVMEYCKENAKTVYKLPSPEKLISRGSRRDKVTANTGPGLEICIAGENGKAAVYTKAPELLHRDELEKLQGEIVYGQSGFFSVSRLAGSESWEYLVVNNGGYLQLVKFASYAQN